MITSAGDAVSYSGIYEPEVRDYRGLVLETRFRVEGASANSESYVAFDSDEASVLIFSHDEGTGISARNPSPDFSTFDFDGIPAANVAVTAQIRFDGAVVTATVNGVPLALDSNYADVLGDAQVSINAGCYGPCAGISLIVDEVSLWPSCRP
jgi:hypothetical protein